MILLIDYLNNPYLLIDKLMTLHEARDIILRRIIVSMTRRRTSFSHSLSFFTISPCDQFLVWCLIRGFTDDTPFFRLLVYIRMKGLAPGSVLITPLFLLKGHILSGKDNILKRETTQGYLCELFTQIAHWQLYFTKPK